MACSLSNIEVIQILIHRNLGSELKKIFLKAFSVQKNENLHAVQSSSTCLRPGTESTRMIESCIRSPFVRTFVWS